MTQSGGKVALVTGAGSGIGRAAAIALAGRSYRLVLAGRHLETLDETKTLLGDGGSRALSIAADVTDTASVAQLFDDAAAAFGRIDLLFNNAGVDAPAMPLAELPIGDWRHVIDTNVTGAFLCLQAAFRQMIAQDPQGGRIINNGSLAAHSPRPDSVAYTVSKHAITGLTKQASLDGRQHNIACGQIDIGNAASAMGARASAGRKQADGTIRPEPVMALSHVGDAIAYMDSLPIDANVQFMTLMATTMPYLGRG